MIESVVVRGAVGHVVRSMQPTDGGVTTAVCTLTKRLTERGVESRIVSGRRQAAGSRRGSPCLSFRGWRRSSSRVPLTKVLSAVRTSDVIVFHSIWDPSFPAGALACSVMGRRYVVFPHGSLAEADLVKRRRLKKVLGCVVVIPLLQRAEVVIATSPTEQRDVMSFCPQASTRLAPLPVGDDFTTMAARNDVPTDTQTNTDSPSLRLLFAGRLDPRKGLDMLIMALAYLPEGSRPILDIYSETAGAEFTRLEARIRASKLENNVSWRGWTPPSALAAKFRETDLVCLLSATENFALTVHEALAAGTPVLIADNLDIAQVVSSGPYGFTVPREPKAIAALLSSITEDRYRLHRCRDELVRRQGTPPTDATDVLRHVLDEAA